MIKTAEDRNNLTYHVVLVSVALILSKDQIKWKGDVFLSRDFSAKRGKSNGPFILTHLHSAETILKFLHSAPCYTFVISLLPFGEEGSR